MMDPILMSMEDAETITSSPVIGRYLGVAVGVPVAAVELGDHDGAEIARRLSRLPLVTVGVGSSADHAWDIRCEDPQPIFEGVLANPIAAVTAAQVLRGAEHRSVHDALLVESLAYATLQSGPEFAAWLETQGRRVRDNDDPRIQVHEHAERVDVILDRPRLFNLVDAQMRDELIDVFRVLAERPDLAIGLSGAGPSFCAGGDPAEFGTVADPATAHTIRSTANLGAYIHRVAERVTARVHGLCIGAGVEMMAFCNRVQAHPETWFRLPEILMGLLPGVGGTVSIPARIGRHRTLEWLLQDTMVDSDMALEWGLVDSIGEFETDPAEV